MPISMDRSLRHMSWANQRVFAAFQSLPDEVLDSYIVNPEWNAGKILQHIVASADWYVYCLGLDQWHDIPVPERISEVAELSKTLQRLDTLIHSACESDEQILEFKDEVGVSKVWRSTLLAEATLHATEHRAQLMDAIESKGFSAISLDSIDLWSFESFEKDNRHQ